jgi:hypothetical protein
MDRGMISDFINTPYIDIYSKKEKNKKQTVPYKVDNKDQKTPQSWNCGL